MTVLANPNAAPFVIGTPAQNQSVECDGLGDNAVLLAWLGRHADATVTGATGPVGWSNDYSPANFVYNSPNCAAGHVTVNFTAINIDGRQATTSGTFTVVDTTAPTLVWYVEGEPVNDGASYTFNKKDLPITVQVVAVDLCGGATLTKHVSNSSSGSSKVTFAGDTFTITAASVGSNTRFTAKAVDDCGNASAKEWLTVNIVQPGKGQHGGKGNEGSDSDSGCNSDHKDDSPFHQSGTPSARNKHR